MDTSINSTIREYTKDMQEYNCKKCKYCKKTGVVCVYTSSENVSHVDYNCSNCGKRKGTSFCSEELLNVIKKKQIRDQIKSNYPGRYQYILEKYCDGDEEKFDSKKFTIY